MGVSKGGGGSRGPEPASEVETDIDKGGTTSLHATEVATRTKAGAATASRSTQAGRGGTRTPPSARRRVAQRDEAGGESRPPIHPFGPGVLIPRSSPADESSEPNT